MTAEDETFQKWTGWTDTIHKDVTDLVIGRHIFWHVQGMIKANPKIQKPSSFYAWIGMTYVAWGSMGVRRQLDNDSLSLKRLLNETAKNAQILSRKRYVAAFAATLTDSGVFDVCEAEQMANESFDQCAGRGCMHISKDSMERDVDELRKVGDKVKTFADKRVAHLLEGSPTLPTFGELDACIDILEKLVLKYELIIKRSAPHSLLPTWQYDWKAIFYEQWIPRP